ncbi:hypothetical protein [Pseudomonas rubra]|uniref:Antitoxin ParD1/3/4 n=1 Tax=Pseudomonas rubra TaxID=2942627 RepID=A0ABT5PFA1_9PSED|nr:hypothetical protein [Pseudomonas rubra]MDD1016870.1 hypothetical protein [Pseudomonas rubra]MDD1039384.1 hypothetical protein [Pseudomonas rubra]MDD1157834.1 hypothetical protein [Pseudomonas rubra]
MSPHVLIGEAIISLDERYSLRADKRLEALIVSHFTAGTLDADEFKHYCERVRRVAERRKEAI